MAARLASSSARARAFSLRRWSTAAFSSRRLRRSPSMPSRRPARSARLESLRFFPSSSFSRRVRSARSAFSSDWRSSSRRALMPSSSRCVLSSRAPAKEASSPEARAREPFCEAHLHLTESTRPILDAILQGLRLRPGVREGDMGLRARLSGVALGSLGSAVGLPPGGPPPLPLRCSRRDSSVPVSARRSRFAGPRRSLPARSRWLRRSSFAPPPAWRARPPRRRSCP